MKYSKTIEVDAEQFLRSAKELPAHVRGGGKGVIDMENGEFSVATRDGIQFLRDGDYIVYEDEQPQYVVSKEIFDKEYRKVN